MSISVQCPNPDCEVTHKVKNKYSGMLCKCPACGTAMLVPKKKPLGADSAPPGGLRGFGGEASRPAPAATATEDDELAAFMAAAEEEGAAPAAVEEEEEAVAVAEEDEDVAVAVEEDEEVVAEAEEEEVVAEGDYFSAEVDLDEPAPKKGKDKGKSKSVFDEDDILADEVIAEAEEEEEPAPKKGKGKKGKNPFDDEDVLAEEEVEAAIEDEDAEAAALLSEEEEEPAPKKGKGKKEEPKKKAKSVFDDEDVLAEEVVEEEEEPAPKKGKGKKEEPKKKGRRMLDEEEEAASEEAEEGEGKPAGGLSKTAATLMILGIAGAGMALTSLFMDIYAVNGVIPAGVVSKEMLRIPDEAKTVLLGATGTATALSLFGLLLAWRGRGYGVFSLLLAYLGWIAAAAYAIFMSAVFFTLSVKFKEAQGLVTAGPGLWLGISGGFAAAILMPAALYVVHRRTWARIILILLFGGALALCIWFTNHMKEEMTTSSPRNTPSQRR